MIHKFPNFDAPIARLFELANTPLDPQSFRRACERFATFDTNSSHDDLWYFSTSGGPSLIVTISQPEYRPLAVSCAILSICWWETFLKMEHEKLESWEAERVEFDRFYAESLADAITILGLPQVQGMDADERQHRHAIWRGETGLLILQQSGYDPQFGLDVNYWVQPWSGRAPSPTSPFVNWLYGLSSHKRLKPSLNWHI